ncbi:hypothetical protein D3C85_1590260 [compost metagenome]
MGGAPAGYRHRGHSLVPQLTTANRLQEVPEETDQPVLRDSHPDIPAVRWEGRAERPVYGRGELHIGKAAHSSAIANGICQFGIANGAGIQLQGVLCCSTCGAFNPCLSLHLIQGLCRTQGRCIHRILQAGLVQ